MEERKVTIKDIAEELGLSTATVSNVIHGKTKKISERTVCKVQEKLQESGYIPNMAAVLLAQNSSKIVCVMLSEHEKYEGRMLEDPFVSQMLNTISKELTAHGYFMMVKEERDIERIVAYASMWNMAGLILMGYCAVDYENLRAKMHIPFVVVDAYEKNIKSYIDVGIDNIDGGYQAGSYLIEKGHRNILYLADNKEDCDLDRYLGLMKACKENRLPQPEENYYVVSMDREKREQDFEDILSFIRKTKITAVFAASDYYALELMRFFMKRGIKIPEELSIMGFDDIPLAAQIYPGLTTISQNIPLRAKTAVEMLNNLIERKTEGGSILLPVLLIERESVARVHD
ncbi:MAG: LacI family DNA-binding transcriptional regulator [Lachnospiraceae bacterium]|nr:LacI family DNA-binding transcriptional regulator [Lachnospiraceae bacterium]